MYSVKGSIRFKKKQKKIKRNNKKNNSTQVEMNLLYLRN